MVTSYATVVISTFLLLTNPSNVNAAMPVIFDTDYGPFIDDIFALGLLLNSDDVLDLRYIIATEENPTLGAQCIAKHLQQANKYGDIPVGIGETLPDYSVRGGVCAVPGFLGFALEEKCNEFEDLYVDVNGVESVAELLEQSDEDEFMYIVVGGQTSLNKLIADYPEAASKLSTLIVMGGNWCADFQPYPDVDAPTDETNISCDPMAANAIVDGNFSPFDHIYYVPVVVADEIGGDDYMQFVEAAQEPGNFGAATVLDFYIGWSEAGRADPDLLIHLEAMTYDPETESTPQFDACAIMLAIELLNDESCDDRLALFDFEAIHFYETGENGTMPFPETPRSSFSLKPVDIDIGTLPEQCPALTPFDFDPDDTPEEDMPVTVALGFTSNEAKQLFYGEMAARMAGTFSGEFCYGQEVEEETPTALDIIAEMVTLMIDIVNVLPQMLNLIAELYGRIAARF